MSLKPYLVTLSIVALLLTLNACRSLAYTLYPPDVGQLLNERLQNPFADSWEMPVYLATNRDGDGRACNDKAFGVELNEQMRYGRCPVNVPKKHTVGALDTIDSPYGDPNTYFKFGPIESLEKDAFFSSLANQPGDEILLFVHGFNVKFEEAANRAAQIGYDTKFQGPVVLFTWPAGAEDSFLSGILISQTYRKNRDNAQNTIDPFVEFMQQLSDTGKRIHVVVHSMGHQIVLPGLAKLHARDDDQLIGQLVLNAPDFATSDFEAITPHLIGISQRVTLYCSPGDNALVASRELNNNHRVGLCKRVDGIDVINVNEVDSPALGVGGLGHGYYSGRAVLTDLYQVLLGVDVDKRLFIRRSDTGGGEDYILRR
ncbi:MAG: alpha/beta hydrolase [Leptospiraceae bacterium]|nr:alpha/beta hydrolase [Leptospiraceae bacterium]